MKMPNRHVAVSVASLAVHKQSLASNATHVFITAVLTDGSNVTHRRSIHCVVCGAINLKLVL